MNVRLLNLLLLCLLIFSCKADFNPLPEEENIFNLSTEEELQDRAVADRIDKFYDEGLDGAFIGKEKIPIYYKIFEQAEMGSPAILISAGRTEAAVKYK